MHADSSGDVLTRNPELAAPAASRPLPRWLTPSLQIALLAVVIASPYFGLPRLTANLMSTILLLGVAATGVNLMFGIGMLSMGSALYLGAGGYGVALAKTQLHWSVIAAVPVSIIATMALAAIVGVIVVRLSSHYFAVANLGLAIAFEGILMAFPSTTGGDSGLTGTRELPLGFTTVTSNTGWYIVTLIAAGLALALLTWATAGRRGRLMQLIRSDGLAASVLGARVLRTKLLVYVLGAAFAAFAGSLLFPFQGLITPDTAGPLESLQLLALVVIGGAGYKFGGFVGAFVITWLQALIDTSGNDSLLVYGLVFLLVAFYLRPGLEGAVVDLWQRFTGAERLGRRRVAAQALADAEQEAPGSWIQAGADARRGDSAGLEISNAQRRFGGVVAVNDVTISVPAGRITALIGSNGAGKSTLANLISGVERLDDGSITLGGEDIGHLTPADRTRLGIVRTFQVPRLVDELSVLDNVILGTEAAEPSLFGRDASREREERAIAQQSLASASLASLAPRRVRSIGTGERKFVELVRAVNSKITLGVLDEPAVGLSLTEIDRLQEWLHDLRSAGAAVLVIDHNLDFIQRLADHVYVMDLGEIISSGSPDEVLG
jgi:ABC-type branched-subunit amino acid transport system ATPase component/ABC-type branched-subunit amino acid transport system permease subunit